VVCPVVRLVTVYTTLVVGLLAVADGSCGDLNGLAPARHRDDLDAALLHPAVSAGGRGACGQDVFPRQSPELSTLGWFPLTVSR